MKDIILIGPVAVGKTTTAKLLSEKLNKPLQINTQTSDVGRLTDQGRAGDIH